MERSMTDRSIHLGSLLLDPIEMKLLGPDGAVQLRPKTFAVLAFLAKNGGRIVSKDELLETVWPGLSVTDDAITHCISEARRAIGSKGPELIRTLPRRGYLLAIPVGTQAPRSDWEKGLARKSDLLPFARRHSLAVVATNSPGGVPQSAVVRFFVTGDFELIVTSHREHRKVANLKSNPFCSAVIGWDELQTLQIEGRGELLHGAARDCAIAFIAEQSLELHEWRRQIEGLQYIRIVPTWMRYSDFRMNPASILTVDLVAETESRSARIYRADPA
jgi:DNA-binding winged helix-turn-helix (wHTH) protein